MEETRLWPRSYREMFSLVLFSSRKAGQKCGVENITMGKHLEVLFPSPHPMPGPDLIYSLPHSFINVCRQICSDSWCMSKRGSPFLSSGWGGNLWDCAACPRLPRLGVLPGGTAGNRTLNLWLHCQVPELLMHPFNFDRL